MNYVERIPDSDRPSVDDITHIVMRHVKKRCPQMLDPRSRLVDISQNGRLRELAKSGAGLSMRFYSALNAVVLFVNTIKISEQSSQQPKPHFRGASNPGNDFARNAETALGSVYRRHR